MAAKRTVFFDLDKEAYRLLASHFKAFRHGQDSKVPWLKYDKDIKEVALHAKKAGESMYTVQLQGQDEHISFYAYKTYIVRQEQRKAAKEAKAAAKEAKAVAKAQAAAAAVANVAAMKAAAAEQAAAAAAAAKRKAARKGSRSRGACKASTAGTTADAGITSEASTAAAAATTFQATPRGCLAGCLGRKPMTARTATTAPATAWRAAVVDAASKADAAPKAASVDVAVAADATASAQDTDAAAAAAAAAHHTDRKALLAAHKAAITAITGTPPPAAGAAASAALMAATNSRLGGTAGTGRFARRRAADKLQKLAGHPPLTLGAPAQDDKADTRDVGQAGQASAGEGPLGGSRQIKACSCAAGAPSKGSWQEAAAGPGDAADAVVHVHLRHVRKCAPVWVPKARPQLQMPVSELISQPSDTDSLAGAAGAAAGWAQHRDQSLECAAAVAEGGDV